MKVADAIPVIMEIQGKNPKFLLGGSVALVLTGSLPEREIGDIDFILNKNQLNGNLFGFSSLRFEPYAPNVDDRYASYRAYYNLNGLSYEVNLLVFDNDIALNEDKIIYFNNKSIKIQKVDDILQWKQKYNRDKDITDLNNIADKFIENILTQ